ncbi:MAG: PEGA domain-containing protein [Polyangiales bacterium]
MQVRWIRCMGLTAGLALVTSAASAQSSEDALLSECYALRRAGRNDASLARCEQAVALSRSGRALAQLALTEMALERWVDAANHIHAALAAVTDPWVQRNRAALDTALTSVSAHVSMLRVESNVPGSTVRLNGREVGTTPMPSPLAVAPGVAEVELRAPDGRRASRSVTLRAGASAGETFTFEAVAPSPAPVVSARPPSPPPTPTPVTPRPLPEPARGAFPFRTLAWTSGGIAVAGLGLALVAWRAREGAVSDYVGRCPQGDTSDAALASACAADRASAAEDVSRWEALTTVGLVTSGLFAVAATVLFVAAPSTGPRRSALRCGPGPGAAGMRCGLEF